MSTIRGVKDRKIKFTQILNSMAEDKDLSLKAKGFITFCLTKPESWKFHVDHLSTVLKEGHEAIYSTIKECIKCGYAYKYQLRNDKGKFESYEFVISDSKEEIDRIKQEIASQQQFQPHPGFPDADVPDADNPPLSNNKIRNKKKGIDDDDASAREKTSAVQSSNLDLRDAVFCKSPMGAVHDSEDAPKNAILASQGRQYEIPLISGGVKILTSGEAYSVAIQRGKDWTQQEIETALFAIENSCKKVRDWVRYLEGIIENNRLMRHHETKTGKICKQKILKPEVEKPGLETSERVTKNQVSLAACWTPSKPKK